MRHMSFMLTTEQYGARTKDVTRRIGWAFLKPGDVVMGVVKSQGLKKGEKVEKLHPFHVRANNPERLDSLLRYPNQARGELRREGFPLMTPGDFITMFCRHNRCEPSRIINRITFGHLP